MLQLLQPPTTFTDRPIYLPFHKGPQSFPRFRQRHRLPRYKIFLRLRRWRYLLFLRLRRRCRYKPLILLCPTPRGGCAEEVQAKPLLPPILLLPPFPPHCYQHPRHLEC